MRTPPLPSPATAPQMPGAKPSNTHTPALSPMSGLSDFTEPSYPMPSEVDPDLADIAKTATHDINHADGRATYGATAMHMNAQDLLRETTARTPEDNERILADFRRKMEEALISREKNHTVHKGHDNQPTSHPGEHAHDPLKERASSPGSPRTLPDTGDFAASSMFSSSTDSANTIRFSTSRPPRDSNGQRTASYPFPDIPSDLRTDSPVEATGHGHHFARPTLEMKPSLSRQDSSIPLDAFLPMGATADPGDAVYPTPNLYDLALTLNADPGLDAWWSNVTEVLQRHYGAERATLAVPGDITDLENVPWGQKATFNTMGHGVDAAPPERPVETARLVSPIKEDSSTKLASKIRATAPPSSVKRPKLVARHSFPAGGFAAQSPSTNAKSPLSTRTREIRYPSTSEETRLVRDTFSGAGRPRKSSETQEGAPGGLKKARQYSGSTQYSSTALVLPIVRELEVEHDPLIKRTGVVKLFGRTKPAILTREYTIDTQAQANSDAAVDQPLTDKVQITPAGEEPPRESLKPDIGRSKLNIVSALGAGAKRPKRELFSHGRLISSSSFYAHDEDESSSTYAPGLDLYEEYEQTPPSPWSQSPAPSPAPLKHPEENPFFRTHKIDEEAFTSTPPPHDYSGTEPLHAIGVDRAKTVVHIPLLHSPSSRQRDSATLRFPLAIISFLTPIIPYPTNLRRSLEYLLPHLTTSYCLADQYTRLEKQNGASHHRYGQLLGLGGTFSDASSELELVAGLSGHVNYTVNDEGSVSAHASLSSPDGSSMTKFSPAISMTGTPGIELAGFGFVPEPLSTPALATRQEQTDSYFNLQQSKGSTGQTVHLRPRHSVKTKQVPTPSIPSSPNKLKESASDEVGQEPMSVSSPELGGKTIQNWMSPGAASRQASTTSMGTQMHREITPRPFPDTIAQLMLNSVPLHLFLAKSQSGEVIWTNAKFDAYRRSQPEEQRVRDPWQNVHAADRDNLSKEWRKALRTGSQFTERVRVKRFNDESAYRWFIFRANPLLSGTGELLYWIGSFLDVHEQHMAEMKAAQEKEMFATDAKFRALANSIPQVVFEAGENRGLISANEQWHLFTGQTLEEALNLGFTKHIHWDDLEKCGIFAQPPPDSQDGPDVAKSGESLSEFSGGVTPVLTELVQRGVFKCQHDENGRMSYSTEIRLRSRGGEFRWHLVRLVKVETTSFGSGEASWYGTCTDINDRKLLERELNRAMQKLNKEMESKTKFFSNMSHEIRTPLNGILGTIPFILDTQLDNDQRRMLDTIQNSSTNLRELVDNILDVSKVEAGKMNLVKAWFHVRSVLEDAIDTIASRAIDKGLELNYLVDVDVPAMVIGDKFRIRQVLINLMGNAVKFTSQGEVYAHCSVVRDPNAKLDGSELLLNFEVVDTGKGFSSADAERLMQRFSQIEGTGSQQHTGSGLGLFLSKQLVEMHGGRLTPSSREGQGAKFSFFVKLDAPPFLPPKGALPGNESLILSEAASSLSKKSRNEDKTPVMLNPTEAKKPMSYDGPGSPAISSPGSSDPSVRSWFNHHHSESSISTTNSFAAEPLGPKAELPAAGLTGGENEISVTAQLPPIVESQKAASLEPAMRLNPSMLSPLLPAEFAVLVICPLDHAREAVKQHIEQIIPHDVIAKITAVSDLEDWKEMLSAGDCANSTHLVLGLPDANDVLEVMQHFLQVDPAQPIPSLVLISDLYQKRKVTASYEALEAAGRKMYSVPKPVKPSAFSCIFDPDNKRDLSKDRNQDMAREVNNNFKTMSKIVKEVIGNKGYRILLVEDDETNRMVMLKYLDKVKVVSETAGNGQECVEMVFSKEPGYYSLIICDIQMPIKNGYETCQEIRAWEQKNHFPQIPIMALSANAMMDQIDNAARAGFNDYVTKPIKHNELGKMMMALLDPSTPHQLLRDRKN